MEGGLWRGGGGETGNEEFRGWVGGGTGLDGLPCLNLPVGATPAPGLSACRQAQHQPGAGRSPAGLPAPPQCDPSPTFAVRGEAPQSWQSPPSHVVPAAGAPVLPAAVWPWHVAHPWNPSPLEGCVLPPWCLEVWAPMTGCSRCPPVAALALGREGFVPHEGPGDGVQPGPLRGGHRVQCYMAQPLDFVGAPTGPVDS